MQRVIAIASNRPLPADEPPANPPGIRAMSAAADDGRTTLLKCSASTLRTLHTLVPKLEDVKPDDKLAHVARHLQTMSDAEDQD